MHVLFYVEPLTELDAPRLKAGWVRQFVTLMINSIRAAEPTSNFCCVVGDGLEDIAKASLSECQIVTIEHTELVPRFGPSSLAVAQKWYQSSSAQQREEMADLLMDRVQGFEPDVCITFSPAPFLEKAFPSSTTLYFELGLVSRAPFPMTAYLDPLGMLKNGYPATHSRIVKNHVGSQQEIDLVDQIRTRYLTIISQGNPFSAEIAPTLKKFKASILVALQFSQFYAYDAHATFPDQYDLIIQTLNSVDTDIAVVVVEHPQHLVLTEETIQYLQSKYSNFIYDSRFKQVPSASQYLLEHVDLVITVSSSVGLQAMLWKKPLLVLGSSHLDAVADSHELTDIKKLLQTPWPEHKEHILAWHLSRYSIPFDLLFGTDMLVERIQLARDCAKNGDYSPYFDEPFAEVKNIKTAYLTQSKIAELSILLVERDDQIARLCETVESLILDRDSKEEGLKLSRQSHEELVMEYNRLKAELDSTVADLRAGKADLENCNNKYAELFISNLAEASKFNRNIEMLSNQFSELSIAIQRTNTRIDRFNQTMSEREEITSELSTPINFANAQHDGLDKVSLEKHAQLNTTNARAEDPEVDNRCIQPPAITLAGSRCWRLTKPVRVLRRIWRGYR